MLILIAVLVLGSLWLRNSFRLEGESGPSGARKVDASVDGKPVHSYVKEK